MHAETSVNRNFWKRLIAAPSRVLIGWMDGGPTTGLSFLFVSAITTPPTIVSFVRSGWIFMIKAWLSDRTKRISSSPILIPSVRRWALLPIGLIGHQQNLQMLPPTGWSARCSVQSYEMSGFVRSLLENY